MWPPELETLDQLCGGDLPLSVIYGLFGDDDRFRRGVRQMLKNGEVRLLTHQGEEIPSWNWTEILSANWSGYKADTPRLALCIPRRG